MSDILSQDEIDALLNALDVSELQIEETTHADTRRVKEYDFKRPDKFSKDQIRTLFMVMESFARSWSTLLAGKLRSLVYLEIVSIDQLPYEEFIRSTFTPSVIAIFSASPLKGNAIMDISPPVAFTLIERLVGGTGGGTTKVRELTEIEEALMENVVTDALRVLKNSMGEIVQANPRLEDIEYNPQYLQIVPPSEIILFVSFEMRIEDSRGMVGLCLPFLLLEPILQDLSTERFFRRSQEEEDQQQRRSEVIMRTLRSTQMEIKVEIGCVELDVEQVLELFVGDVVTLPTRLGDLFGVYVGSDPRPRFLARPGLIGRYKGIEIMDFYEE
jgi:flagellar motor switch protein FliM